MGKISSSHAISYSSRQLTQDREVKSTTPSVTDAEINSRIAFNKVMGIFDHPLMRSMCKNLLENAKSQSKMETPLIKDDDGLKDFDPDTDNDEQIDAFKCSFQDENWDFTGRIVFIFRIFWISCL